MEETQTGVSIWKVIFPTRALLLLMGIGIVDLISTAVLHHHGLIVELNPLMRPLIEQSEWLFVAVKGMTLLLAWIVMAKNFNTHRDFVRTAATAGACAYVGIWLIWFIGGTVVA